MIIFSKSLSFQRSQDCRQCHGTCWKSAMDIWAPGCQEGHFHESMNSEILREAYLCPVFAGVHIFKLLGKDTEFQTKSIPSEHIISLQRIGR